jgi:hypothetical protein
MERYGLSAEWQAAANIRADSKSYNASNRSNQTETSPQSCGRGQDCCCPGTANPARHDKRRAALDSRGNSGSCFGASLFDVASPRSRFGHLLRRNADIDFLVAAGFSSFHKFRIFEAMNNSIESLLEDDHQSLDRLFAELDEELEKPNLARAFELLDLFWARLAVHIRAENLHLFPTILNASDSRFTGKDGLPTFEVAKGLLLRLRSDHDFFMKELAQIIKVGREIVAVQAPSVAEFDELRPRLTVIRTRLEAHNRLEEDQLYKWPGLLFDKSTLADLSQRLHHELENLPPRFA